MTNEEAKKILQSLIPKSIRGDGKSTMHLQITEALLMGMDALDKTKWIPVSERLPEGADYCLCCDKDGHMAIGRMSNWSSYWCFDDDSTDIDVIAWMPLPEDYKEGEDI